MRYLLFLICCLFPLSVSALTVITRFVDVDCANNGDGTAFTCAGAPAGAGAYNTLAAAITGEVTARADLVSRDEQLTIECQGTAADTSEPEIGGFTTDGTRYVHVKGSANADGRHAGVWSTSKYRISNSNYHAALWISDAFVRVEGIQIENTSDNGGLGRGVRMMPGATGDVRVIGNIIRYGYSGGSPITNAAHAGIATNQNTDASGQVYTFVNNIIYNFAGYGIWANSNGTTSSTYRIYNNTITDINGSTTGQGIYVDKYGTTPVFHIKNNIFTDTDYKDYYPEGANGTVTTTKNITEDATSPDSLGSKSIDFVSTSDFHLVETDVAAIDQGSDLSGDPQYPFSTDVDNGARTGSWDIGADESPYTGPVAPPVYVEDPEVICPDGDTPRADIIKCMGFTDSTNCVLGQEATCLDDNGIAAASYEFIDATGFRLQWDGGAVGQGYIGGSGPIGGTGPGYQNGSLGGSLTHVRYRYYFRLGEGWLGYQGHGPSVQVTGTGCAIGGGGTGLEIGGNNYFYYMASTCAGPYTTNIPINQPNPPKLYNNRWYRAEIEGQIDTACTDDTDMYGCNGLLKVWIDDTLVMSYSNINWSGTTNTGRFTDYWGPRFYHHKRTPTWKPEISFDQFVISNNGTAIGAAPGAVTGSPVLQSPYLGHWNVEPFLGHNPAEDCATFSSYLQTKDGYQWRGGAALSTEQVHSGMTDQCVSATPDNSMKVNIAATANGGGLYWDRTDWENNFGGTATFSGYPSLSVHGWIYLPAGNDYTNRPLLAGFYGRSTGEDWGRALGITVAGGNFAVVEKNKSIAETRVLAYTSAVAATEATWHEFEIIAWNTDKVTLSINGVKLADKVTLTYDLDYLFTPTAATGILVGVDNFVGTAPFVAYYDDINIGSVSWYSCDGWGADCPWATTFSRSPARRAFRLSGH